MILNKNNSVNLDNCNGYDVSDCNDLVSRGENNNCEYCDVKCCSCNYEGSSYSNLPSPECVRTNVKADDQHSHVNSLDISNVTAPSDCEKDNIDQNSCDNSVDECSSLQTVSFCSWNIDGLLSKLDNADFINYVSSFDIVSLLETYIEHFETSLFPNFTIFCKPAVKLSHRGRRSGGIVVLIKTSLMKFVQEIHTEYDNACAFIIDKRLLGFAKDVLLLCTYIQPENSPYYAKFNIDNGITLLEGLVADVVLNHDGYVLLCGDLNARTSNTPYTVHSDQSCFESSERRDDKDDEVYIRNSQDLTENSYGKMLFNVCSSLGLCILNGACKGDLDGRYTFVSDSGNSVIDYFLASDNIFPSLLVNSYLFVEDRTESCHFPVNFKITTNTKKTSHNNRNPNASFTRVVWQPEKEDLVKQSLLTDDVQYKLYCSSILVDTDIDLALDLFNECMRDCSKCMEKKIGCNSNREKKSWFDDECICRRRTLRKQLRKFRKTLSSEDRHMYCKSRREYKHMLNAKKKCYKDKQFSELLDSLPNQTMFWKKIKSLSSHSAPSNQISSDMWYNHFRSVLEVEDKIIDDEQIIDEPFNNMDNSDPLLNGPITAEEVIKAIKSLKIGKACGPDGIVGEIYKNYPTCCTDFFVKFFNELFDKGTYPTNWTHSIIQPLFKKGDSNNPNNYRGIFLSDISGKLFSKIINWRLQKWIDKYECVGEYQAGFRKDYSTIDHVFTLMSLIQKQFLNNRKLYVAFIDFEKAFDSISRKLMWPILKKNGICGKLLNCVRSMYDNVRARVRDGGCLTEFVDCLRGVKQGDVISPLLFTLFINDLTLDIVNNGMHGAVMSQSFIELFIMLFADDIVLLSETVVGLQNQLNTLHKSAFRLGLNVNLSKSNIVVFRKGGYLAKKEKWLYGNNEMKVVNSYKYLGVIFSTKLSFSLACDDLVARAKKAIICILKVLNRYEISSMQIFVKLFDSKVLPILLYGSEIWGLFDANYRINNAQLFAFKRFLGLSQQTPNQLIYGDTGRYSLSVNACIRVIAYWLKLTRMNNDRLPYKAYKMLVHLDEKNKLNWVSKVRSTLFSYGFGEVWLNEGVENTKLFIRCLRQRLIDCQWQVWSERIHKSERYALYRQFKTRFSKEVYLSLDEKKYIRKTLIRFRFGISDIFPHSQRYKTNLFIQNICPMCKLAPETEVHFVLSCKCLDKLRQKYLSDKFYRHCTEFRLVILMASENVEVIKGLTLFLYHAFKLREIYAS